MTALKRLRASDRIKELEQHLRDAVAAYERQGKELDIYEAALREIAAETSCGWAVDRARTALEGK